MKGRVSQGNKEESWGVKTLLPNSSQIPCIDNLMFMSLFVITLLYYSFHGFPGIMEVERDKT